MSTNNGALELVDPEDSLEDLSIQLQCFPHAPTRQAWDVIQELYDQTSTREHKDFERVKEHIQMFISLCLEQHPEWADTEEQKMLMKQAQVRRNWVLSSSGDQKARKVDHIWYGYFATGDLVFPDKVIQLATDTKATQTVREAAIWSYDVIARTCHGKLMEYCPNMLQLAETLRK